MLKPRYKRSDAHFATFYSRPIRAKATTTTTTTLKGWKKAAASMMSQEYAISGQKT